MTDQEAIDWLKRIAALEQEPDCHKTTITMGPWSAFIAISAWQLAMRHPGFSPANSELVGSLIEQLSVLFDGTPGAELVRAGNDSARDVPRAPEQHLAVRLLVTYENDQTKELKTGHAVTVAAEGAFVTVEPPPGCTIISAAAECLVIE